MLSEKNVDTAANNTKITIKKFDLLNKVTCYRIDRQSSFQLDFG